MNGKAGAAKNAGKILGKGQKSGASSNFLPDTLENVTGVWQSYCHKAPKVLLAPANWGVAIPGAGRQDPGERP